MSEEVEKAVGGEKEAKKAESGAAHDLIDLDHGAIRVKTHTKIDSNYVGHVEKLTYENSIVSLVTTAMMSADDQDLVHSGFIGSAAEYTALVVVNEPNGMVFSVNAQYYACARAGDEIKFTGKVRHSDNRKREVHVVGNINAIKIYDAKIVILIPEYHPLKIKLLDVAGADH